MKELLVLASELACRTLAVAQAIVPYSHPVLELVQVLVLPTLSQRLKVSDDYSW